MYIANTQRKINLPMSFNPECLKLSLDLQYFQIRNHAWVSFHGFSEAYNEYATDMSSVIDSFTSATEGLLCDSYCFV